MKDTLNDFLNDLRLKGLLKESPITNNQIISDYLMTKNGGKLKNCNLQNVSNSDAEERIDARKNTLPMDGVTQSLSDIIDWASNEENLKTAKKIVDAFSAFKLLNDC